jgi:hypothetical protein
MYSIREAVRALEKLVEMCNREDGLSEWVGKQAYEGRYKVLSCLLPEFMFRARLPKLRGIYITETAMLLLGTEQPVMADAIVSSHNGSYIRIEYLDGGDMWINLSRASLADIAAALVMEKYGGLITRVCEELRKHVEVMEKARTCLERIAFAADILLR